MALSSHHRQLLGLLITSTFIFFNCCQLVTVAELQAGAPNGLKNEDGAKRVPPPLIKRDESFFGNVDIEDIKESHRKAMQNSFFSSRGSTTADKVDANKSSGGRASRPTSNDSPGEKEHQEFVPPFSGDSKKEKDNNSTNNNNNNHNHNSPPPPICSSETGKKFQCTKRALWSYMRIVRTISNRIETITESSKHQHQYTLQLTVSAEEAHQLKQHIVSLQRLMADYEKEGEEGQGQNSEPEKIRRFCANLDTIEEPTVRLIERTVMPVTAGDSMAAKSRRTSFWSLTKAWISGHLNMKGVTLTVLALIAGLLCKYFFFRAGVPSSRKYLFAVVLLVLGLSLVQFFHQEQEKFLAEQRKKRNVGLDETLSRLKGENCYWWEKTGNLLWRWSGYRCSEVQSSSSSSSSSSSQSPVVIPETELEELFWRTHFNIVAFLLKWAIWMGLLGPFREVALETDRLFEQMVDGKSSENWWDVGAWFRSILWSSLTKPLWVLVIFVLLYKAGLPGLIFKWAFRVMNWAMNEEEEEEAEENGNQQPVDQGPRPRQAQIPSAGGGGVPQLPPTIHIITNHHFHQAPLPFAGVDLNLLPPPPPPLPPRPGQVLRHRAVPAAGAYDDDEDAYLSAED